jgi:hypothetical protein
MWRIAALVLAVACPVLASPALPSFQAPILSLQFGVFCHGKEGPLIPAPGTQLGYIQLAPDTLKIALVHQNLPADIGLAFGVIAQSNVDADVVIKVHRPGLAQPEVWDSTVSATTPSLTFFSFDFPHEQVPGLWAIEAWQADLRLYRAEFLIAPAGSDPQLAGMCDLMS